MKGFALMLLCGVLVASYQEQASASPYGLDGIFSLHAQVNNIRGNNQRCSQSGSSTSSGISNGVPYYTNVNAISVDGKSYKIQSTYNAQTKNLEVKVYTCDVNDPNADYVLDNSCNAVERKYLASVNGQTNVVRSQSC